MARSKRAKVVSLTKVRKQTGREAKNVHVQKVRENVQKFDLVYVVAFSHCKTRHMQLFRERLGADAQLLMVKNSLVKLALGTDKASALEEGIEKLSAVLEGSTGLLCGSLNRSEIESRFQAAHAAYIEEAAMRGKNVEMTELHAGDIAKETIVIPAGPLEDVSFALDSYLRQLGLPSKLHEGKIHVLGDFTICTEGEEVNKDRAQLLKLLGYFQATPELRFKGSYDKRTHKVAIFE